EPLTEFDDLQRRLVPAARIRLVEQADGQEAQFLQRFRGRGHGAPPRSVACLPYAGLCSSLAGDRCARVKGEPCRAGRGGGRETGGAWEGSRGAPRTESPRPWRTHAFEGSPP